MKVRRAAIVEVWGGLWWGEKGRGSSGAMCRAKHLSSRVQLTEYM